MIEWFIHAVYSVLYYVFFFKFNISIFPCYNSSVFIYTPCLFKMYFRHSISLCLSLVEKFPQDVLCNWRHKRCVSMFQCPSFKTWCHEGDLIKVYFLNVCSFHLVLVDVRYLYISVLVLSLHSLSKSNESRGKKSLL